MQSITTEIVNEIMALADDMAAASASLNSHNYGVFIASRDALKEKLDKIASAVCTSTSLAILAKTIIDCNSNDVNILTKLVTSHCNSNSENIFCKNTKTS